MIRANKREITIPVFRVGVPEQELLKLLDLLGFKVPDR